MPNEGMPNVVMAYDMENWAPGPDGKPVKVWKVHSPHNVVVNEGRAYLLNRCFDTRCSALSTGGPFMVLHSGGTASNQSWSQVSASLLGSCWGASGTGNSAPAITFDSAYNGYTSGQITGYTSFQFSSNAAQQTISGAALLWFTSGALATANFTSTGGIKLYNNGSIAAQAVSGSNTVSVSVTLSIQSSN